MKMKTLVWFVIIAPLFALADATTPVVPSLTNTVVNDEGESLLGDGSNRTLYVFDVDQSKAGSSLCNAKCAEVWPPYLLTAQEVAGLKAPLGSIVRDAGTVQLTYNGRPVYTYALDRHSADDQGDGIGGVWHYIQLK